MEKTEGLKREKREVKGALRYIFARLKKHFPALLLLSFMMAAVSALSVSMALFMRSAIDSAVDGDIPAMTRSLITMAAITLLGLSLRFAAKLLQSRLSFKMEMSLRRDLMDSILTREQMSVSAYHSGDLMNRLTSDISVVQLGASGMLPRLFELVSRLAFAFGILVSFSLFFAALTAAAAAVIILVSVLLRPRLKSLHRTAQEAEGSTRAFMQEMLENQLVIRVFGVKDGMLARLGGFQRRGFETAMDRRRLSVFAGEGMSLAFTLGFLAALLWGTLSIAGVFGPERAVSYGTLVAVLQLVSQVQNPVASLSGLVPQFFTMTASAERLMEIEALPGDNGGEELPGNDFEQICVSDVTFAYGADSAPVLEHAQATVRRGEFAAVTGISGIGKSTLMKLILGVYRPLEGSVGIMVSGRSFPASSAARSLFAYVPQGNLLLSGSVRENIAFFDTEAGDGEIMQAARIACAEEFIRELPQGLDTRIGEHGLGLSEGQAQRISIARAVLRRAPVLLLDEATSALDPQTEAELLSNLRSSSCGTVIIITHREAALKVCDSRLSIENGRIIKTETARP